MSFNQEAADLFAYQRSRLRDVEATDDIEALPGLLGCTLREATESRLIEKDIHVRTKQPRAGRRSDIAHEVSHLLAQEQEGEAPSYEEVIKHYHADAPNVQVHFETLITTGQDIIRVPDDMVQTIIKMAGLNARAVWILHQTAETYLHEALRRLVHYNEDGRMGGFIARRGLIEHAYCYRWRMPCWIGHKMPTPEEGFEGDDVSLFEVPGRPGTFIGLVVIEE